MSDLVDKLRSFLAPEACINGTPMVPLHQDTIRRIVEALDWTAEQERAAIVAWLRANGPETLRGTALRIAEAIERGDHMEGKSQVP